MKKLNVLLFVVSMLFLVIPAWGQVEVGVLGGLNLPTFSADPEDPDISYSTGSGFTAGGILIVNLSEAFALQLEPAYLQKGADVEGIEREGFGTVKASARLSYIDVPVLLRFSAGNASLKPYFLVGPDISFLLSSKLDFDNNEVETEDVKDQTENIDFGVNFGGGISLPLGSNRFFIEAQYSLGLVDIFKSGEISLKTRGLQFKTGITFPIGG